MRITMIVCLMLRASFGAVAEFTRLREFLGCRTVNRISPRPRRRPRTASRTSRESGAGRGYTWNLAKDLKPGEVSFQPWAAALYQHRLDTPAKTIHRPAAFCPACRAKTWCRIHSR